MPRKYTERACNRCGAFFYPRNDHIQFCSQACYHSARSANWEQRFWASVDRGTDCWFWRGNYGFFGYGKFSLLHKSLLAHRVAYEITHGAIPSGLFVRHTCDNPPCVNPSHLILGSQADNIHDRDARERTAVGIRHHAHKLSVDQVMAIRDQRFAGATCKAIAEKYDLHITTVSDICRRKTWRHVL